MKFNCAMRNRGMLLAVLLFCGCSAIHSTAVRNLISVEGDKIAAANKAATNFTHTTSLRTESMSNAVSSLNTALQQQQTSELVHALIFSANQNIASKQGVDAHAVTYLIGKLYLTEQAGLDKDVNDQFAQDIVAMQQQATRIQQSWSALKALHEQVQSFAAKSAFASVDANFVAAVAAEIPGASTDIDTVLKNSQKVNDALKTALSIGPLKNPAFGQAQTQLSDIIDLLNRVQATPKTNSP